MESGFERAAMDVIAAARAYRDLVRRPRGEGLMPVQRSIAEDGARSVLFAALDAMDGDRGKV